MHLKSLSDHLVNKRIYLISIGAMVIGGIESQKHSLSTTTMKRLLLGICWITKDLKIKKKRNNGDIISISEPLVLVRSLSDFYVFTVWNGTDPQH